MKRVRVVCGAIVLIAGLGAIPVAGAPGAPPSDPRNDGPAARPGADATTALVRLTGDPLTVDPRTRPAAGARVALGSQAARAVQAELAHTRNAFRAWLRQNAPRAVVTGQHDLAVNAVAVRLNGTPLATLRSAPQVLSADFQSVYHPLDTADPDLGLTQAVQAWRSSAVGGDANAGRGVKVGIIDTGIDVTHPCFSDAGFPATQQLGDHRFTNNKVIAARVFNNKAKVLGYTAEGIQEHGSHTAGTVACDLDTPATVHGVAIPYAVSGVAPAAQLGNYNVFPGQVLDARSEDILDAMEAAYADGMDVVNMSLGGGSHGAYDLEMVAVDDLDQANMVVAVAAGNSGPGHYTVESPGAAERALTAGASSVGHFVGPAVTFGATSVAASAGDFAVVSSDLTAPLGVVTGTVNGLGTACTALPAGSQAGKIAVVSRGACTFSTKVKNAQDAGAVATLVVNNVAGDPVAMGLDATVQPAPTIPAYQVGRANAPALVAANGQAATIPAAMSYFRTANDNIMAGFSSQGPTDTAERRVKPDAVAPGVNVLSSIPVSYCGRTATSCWAFFQGTSMATPHLAGSAAVVRGAHPSWTAEQVRSAVVNTASDGVVTTYSTGTAVVTDVNVAGAGLVNLNNAVATKVAVGPVSTSFGTITRTAAGTRSSVVRLTNLGGSALAVSLSVDSVTGSGVTFTAPASATIPAGGSVDVPVTAAVDRDAPAGDHSAMLRISSGGTQVAHSVLYAFSQ